MSGQLTGEKARNISIRALHCMVRPLIEGITAPDQDHLSIHTKAKCTETTRERVRDQKNICYLSQQRTVSSGLQHYSCCLLTVVLGNLGHSGKQRKVNFVRVKSDFWYLIFAEKKFACCMVGKKILQILSHIRHFDHLMTFL